jgi:hypothetical protein
MARDPRPPPTLPLTAGTPTGIGVASATLKGDRPNFGSQYDAWLREKGGVTNLNAHRNHYQIVSRETRDSFAGSKFWEGVISDLPNIDAKYLIDHKYTLIASFKPEILIKPWNSFLEKTYRKNISGNKNFPEEPDGGWYLPVNWYSRIHDIVRTTIIVKYLDGVPLLIERLRAIAGAEGLGYEDNLEARIDGYYGAHFNCMKVCESYTIELQSVSETFSLKIQITTQIKDGKLYTLQLRSIGGSLGLSYGGCYVVLRQSNFSGCRGRSRVAGNAALA